MSTTKEATTPVPVQTDIRKVESWQDVDRAMGVLRGIDGQLATIGASYDEQIAALEAGKAKATKALVDRRERVENLIADFAKENRSSMPKGRKSMKLVHGTAGWKKASKKVTFTKSEDYTKELAAKRGLDALLNITVKVNKTALQKLTKPEQIALGVRVVQGEDFYIKLATNPAIQYPDTKAGGDELPNEVE